MFKVGDKILVISSPSNSKKFPIGLWMIAQTDYGMGRTSEGWWYSYDNNSNLISKYIFPPKLALLLWEGNV